MPRYKPSKNNRAAWPAQKMGRIALREEGNFWRGYYALPDTMKDAIYLGEIQMAFVLTPERKAAFMGIMREAVGDIVESITGERPEWPNPNGTPAPEHERVNPAEPGASA